jgi:hypothetical protein
MTDINVRALTVKSWGLFDILDNGVTFWHYEIKGKEG